ncbi:sensor domain-containing diguanylate cyclase [Methylobacterium sp. A54F]
MPPSWIGRATAHLHDRASRLIACLGVGVTAGLGALGVYLVVDLHDGALRQAERSATNLVMLIEQIVSRNVQMYDLSLKAAATRAPRADIAVLDESLRRIILFDDSASAPGLGAMLVTDETGAVRIGSNPAIRSFPNLSDTPGFRRHRDQPDAGLVIDGPRISRTTGRMILSLSRRITRPDGSFGGIVSGAIYVSYFQALFGALRIDEGSAVNLFQADGTLIAREPYLPEKIGLNIAHGETYRRFKESRRGSFVAHSAIDGRERLYAFAHLDSLPLLVDIAVSASSIRAAWLPKAIIAGILILGLCIVTLGLTLLLQREVRRRADAARESRAANADLETLALTDSLTDLANRRCYDVVLAREWHRLARIDAPLSLILIDVDHFKRLNDHFGHGHGDDVLRRIAACLREQARTIEAVPCRIGGEEFAVLLPRSDIGQARTIADRIRRAVVDLRIPQAPDVGGIATVSAGVAAARPNGTAVTDALYAAADAALYRAKEAGRNRVRTSEEPCATEQAGRRVA